MKKVICVIAPNGSGKTTLVRILTENYHWFTANLFENEKWEVISVPCCGKGRARGRICSHCKRPRTPDDLALIVGKYGSRIIGGSDRYDGDEWWEALAEAAKYKGASTLLVEALRISDPEHFRDLEKFCMERGLELHTVLIKVDPMTCYKRQVVRGASHATYTIQTVMMRLARSRYLYETIPDGHKSLIENPDGVDPKIASDKLLKVVFDSDYAKLARAIMGR